ncbi:hypothetical protein ACFXPT_38415 [Streptomyces goshikiensis]|uniref:hypothetical protein n=1 Tax=Streptomyces goshikiensis TaxID=1942 RepID=UPI0036B871F6
MLCHDQRLANTHGDNNVSESTGGTTPASTDVTGRAPVEHGFAHLKNWRTLTKVRTDAAQLLRALFVLKSLEINR